LLYVEDFLGGADEEPATIIRVEETDEIFKEAQLNMRSWNNNDETTCHVSEGERTKQ
jgi:hypothetical protein